MSEKHFELYENITKNCHEDQLQNELHFELYCDVVQYNFFTFTCHCFKEDRQILIAYKYVPVNVLI